jgi:4-hydroxybenzoate polyprenyltransferase
MQSHLFGQLMDVDEDKIAGRRSTAISIGVVPAKRLLTVIMALESIISFAYFRGWYVALFMLAGGAFFFLDSLRGPRRYPTLFLKVFFVAWNLVVVGTMYFVWRYGVFLQAVD